MLEMAGSGLLTVSVSADEVPPPGTGLKTVIGKYAPTPKSEAGIAAVNCVVLAKVVVRLAPLTFTTELGTKLPPVRVSVNPGLPAGTLLGDMLESEGTGLAGVFTVRPTGALCMSVPLVPVVVS